MANLRLVALRATDVRSIRASFTDRLDPLIGTSNVTVTSLSVGVPDAAVKSVRITDNIIRVETRPMTPGAQYLVTFQGTDSQAFKNVNGDSFLFEDGRTNVVQIVGPEEPTNQIRDDLVVLLNNLRTYNLERGTFIRKTLDQIGSNYLRTRHDIRQAKNDNYLSFTVTDERKIRQRGPFDRLDEEGAYKILRVGKTPTNATLSTSFSFTSFPFDPVTLQRVDISSETLTAGTPGVAGTFNILTLTTAHGPVTKLNSVVINYSDGHTFDYNISALGYQINNPRYDTDFASTLITLDDDQFKLSETILSDSNFRVPGSGDTIVISYEYKSLGRTVDEDSVQVVQVLDATREPTPALVNSFSLDHAPVVTASGAIAVLAGVQFLDPNSATPFLTTHPAFTKEVPFKYEGLPTSPGEYSVDYETGRVFVFGEDDNGTGTGNFPPAATYKYQKTFVKGLDYTYNNDLVELVRSPIRDLEGETAKILFEYEENLIPGVDFVAQVHGEVIDERIQNRLKTSNSLCVLNSPLTNVFRVFNETSGEVYRVTRFNSDTVFFSSNTPPRILDATNERVEFKPVLNELLIIADEITNSSSVRIFKINLLNNNIINNTDDAIGASYNSSAIFSRTDIFDTELFFDGQLLTETVNIERLTIGKYQIDYRNGVVYVGVSSSQTGDIGTICYSAPVIQPKNPHLISVSDLFHSVNLNVGVSKRINYVSFGDQEITPSSFDVSDERFLDGDTTLPYLVTSSGTITVTDDVKSVLNIYDAFDLNNNDVPTNFAEGATVSGNVITLDSLGIQKSETLTVGAGLTLTVSTLSPGIELNDALSAIRLSDDVELLDGYETISGNTITLAVSSGAAVGNVVELIYTVVLNTSATPVVGYNRGEYYATYSYVADEILVSYEHGDNAIDFRESDALNLGEEYFVTYRAGALRDSLLRNFGSLVEIPEVQSFDIDFPREQYRDSLIGALQSFTKGPTIPAMETLVSSVTKITPQIIEAIFEFWSLGTSHLFLNPILVNGTPDLVSGKFDQGILIDEDGESVIFPVSSNLRLEEGTLEMWVKPNWKGLDNDATLTFSNIQRDGYTLSASNIFIGQDSINPTFNTDGSFTVSKADDPSPAGLPTAVFTKVGIFIFYDEDEERWKVLAKDAPKDGYDGYVYSGTIQSSGEVYDVKFITNLGEVDDVIRSGISKIDFSFNLNVRDKVSPDGYSTTDGYVPGFSFDGITFLADDEHYLFDFAETADRNRFSLFKDGRGYLNFRVYDRGGRFQQKKSRRNSYTVSADISSWAAGELHHVAIAWKLNTVERRDEMHLFVDGFEVPNIIRYGGRPASSSTDRFRQIAAELIAGTIPLKTITNDDLTTTAGSNIVSSASVDFESEGIVAGNTIQILETGFDVYTILSVSANTLTLDDVMPATLAGDARFSVNPYSVTVSSEIDIVPNIAVSILKPSTGVETEIPGVRADIPGYSISKNVFNENILTLLGNADAGDQIVIRTLGLNHRRCRERVYIWGDTQAVLKTQLPPPISLDEVLIKKIILPLTPIGPDNASLVGGDFIATGIFAYQTTNTTEGRRLDVRVTGGNVNFSSATTVTINGTTAGGPTSEVFSFSTPETQNGTEQWLTITGVDVTTTPLNTSADGVAVEIKETFSITETDGNSDFPVVRFAFKKQQGTALQGDGSVIVSDDEGFFALSDVDSLLVISSPASVAGTFTIEGRLDSTTIRLDTSTGVPFFDGAYEIFDVSIARSGFQNGFFFLQKAGTPTDPYPLTEGYYDFDYSAYLEVPFDPIDQTAYIGSNFENEKQADAVIDEFRISSVALTDTRVGETIASNEESITTSFQAINEFRKNNSTLVLLHFNEFPLENDSDFLIFANRAYIQSDSSVNENFNESIVFRDRGLIFDNKGRLTTSSEGTIEFWVSPLFDTYNDPVPRIYFDATSSVVENVTSITRGTVKVSGRIGEVLSVRLQTDVTNSGEEFFSGGSIASDFQTINLNKALPSQQTPVKVTYIPSGLQGDRMTIFKDSEGFITFNVRASEVDYQVRQPVFWSRDSWHRVRASFKFNRQDNQDEIRLWVDGEERGVVLFGSGILFGDGTIFGQTTVGVTDQILIADINFLDPITQFFVGQDFRGANQAHARIDNLRLSNVSRAPISISGQPIDVNFNSNLDQVFPVIEDAFTTFLIDFERVTEKSTDFAILRDSEFGIFNFTINIIDSFDILTDNDRVQQALEAMILALKPGTAKVDINTIR